MKRAGCTAVNLNTIKYFFKETYHALTRNSWLSLSSIGIVTVSLIILGASLLLVVNGEKLTTSIESDMEITADLNEDVGTDERDTIEGKIKNLPNVAVVKFVTKDQALQEMKKSFGDRAELLESMEDNDNNPLPDAFHIKTTKAETVPDVAQDLERIAGIEQVRYGQGMVEKLLTITHWVRLASVAIIILLTLASGFLIATTIRMSVFARRREIGIMKVLGATNWFVRLPFLMEGIILGLVGGLLAVLVVDLGYISLIKKLQVSIPFIQLMTDQNTLLTILGSMIGLGVLIGVLGSWFSLRRFLKV